MHAVRSTLVLFLVVLVETYSENVTDYHGEQSSCAVLKPDLVLYNRVPKVGTLCDGEYMYAKEGGMERAETHSPPPTQCASASTNVFIAEAQSLREGSGNDFYFCKNRGKPKRLLGRKEQQMYASEPFK